MRRIPVIALLLGAGLFSIAAAPAVSAAETSTGLVAFEGTDEEDLAEAEEEEQGGKEKELASAEDGEDLPDEFLPAEEKSAESETTAGDGGTGIIVTALPSENNADAGGTPDTLPPAPGDIAEETETPETQTNAGDTNPDVPPLPPEAENADTGNDEADNAAGNENSGNAGPERDGGILRKITRFLNDERLTHVIEANETQIEALKSAAAGGETGISNSDLWEMTQKLVTANEKILRRTGQLDKIAQRQSTSLQNHIEQIDSFMQQKGAQLTDTQKEHFMQKKAQLEQRLASFNTARQQLSQTGNTLQTGSMSLKQGLKDFVDAATTRMAAGANGRSNAASHGSAAPWTQALSGNAVPYSFGGAAAASGTRGNTVSSAAKDRRFSDSMNSIDRANKQNSDRLRQNPQGN